METKILLQNDPLWIRLQNFYMDNPDADFPFSKKLAKEENWTQEFTEKAIKEYKKFIYLCCRLPKGASPSDIIDKVWHMHLIYTENYWEEFCPNVLQQKLHHHPSMGGSSEKGKHKEWYSETLKSYEDVFQESPVSEIWLNKKEDKRRGKLGIKFLQFLAVISVFLIVQSCSEGLSDFMAVIAILIPFLFLLILFLSWLFNPDHQKNQNKDGGSDGCGSDSSSSDSSCGSGCGGGCGGCGGGD